MMVKQEEKMRKADQLEDQPKAPEVMFVSINAISFPVLYCKVVYHLIRNGQDDQERVRFLVELE